MAIAVRDPAAGGRAAVRSAVFQPLEVATDRCKGCSLCISACPHDVLAIDESAVNALGYHPISVIAPGACTSCALCARVCPDSVFTVFAASRKA